jgi:hypothetical protein
MKKFYNISFPIVLILFIIYGVFLLVEDSYRSLHDYRFVVAIKSELISNKKLELIDIMHNVADFSDDDLDLHNIERSNKVFNVFKFKKSTDSFYGFTKRINDLEGENLDILFRNLWQVINLPIEIVDGFVPRSKKQFIIDLFSRNNEIMKFRFNFAENVNKVFKNLVVEDEGFASKWNFILHSYFDNNSNIFSILLKNNFDIQHVSVDGVEFTEEEKVRIQENKGLSYFWIEKKFNIGFFAKSDVFNEKYTVLPSLVSLLWIGIFIIITILSLSLFSALYLYAFVDDKSNYKKFFLNFLEFYQFLPEILLIGFGYIFFIIFLKIGIDSILLIGINLFLIIFPLIVSIVFRSLNLLTNNLKQDLRMTESKVKFLISNVLPVISPYVAYHILKTIAWSTNFGFLIIILVSNNYSFKVPHGFSNSGSFFVSDFLISVIHKIQNIDLASPILLVLLIMNIFFYLIAFFIKRFIKFDLN